MRARTLRLLTACILITGVAGCGGKADAPKAPFETSAVEGKVAFKGGKGRINLLERGKVWFKSKSDPKVEAVGTIDGEGAFTMSTLTSDRAWPGVPPGQYKVRLEVPLDDDREPQTNIVLAKYLDYDKSGITVSVPVPNDFTIIVERPR
jgi:hypothetical protein